MLYIGTCMCIRESETAVCDANPTHDFFYLQTGDFKSKKNEFKIHKTSNNTEITRTINNHKMACGTSNQSRLRN